MIESCLINLKKVEKNEVQELLAGAELVNIENQVRKEEERLVAVNISGPMC